MFKTLSPMSAMIRVTAIGAMACIAAPVLAAGDKPISITVPASSVKDETSRVCMPRTILGRNVDKTLPATLCETRSEWSARGVSIVTK